MPQKRRTENKGYPTGWAWDHGAIYYYVPKEVRSKWDNKRKYRLGSNEAEAYKVWASKVELPETPEKIGPGLDKFLSEVVPTLSTYTQISYTAAIEVLREVFADMAIVDFDHTHAYQYKNRRKRKIIDPNNPTKIIIKNGKERKVPNYMVSDLPAKTAANRELEVMSAFFSKCFEWGVPGLKVHPMADLKFKKHSLPSRDRIVEDWEMQEAMNLQHKKFTNVRSTIPMMKAYIRLKNITGRRRIELLRVNITKDLLEEGVRFQIAKQRNGRIKHKIVEWNDDLRAAINDAIAARPIGKKTCRKFYSKWKPVDISPWLFCKADGTPYIDEDGTTSNAFESAWKRFMDALLERTAIKERFCDSDLRSKAADDADDLQHAQELLDHTTQATTRKHYRRKPETVKPIR